MLDNDTFPAQGGSLQSLYLNGVFTDGLTEGEQFLNTNRLFCAFSSSLALQARPALLPSRRNHFDANPLTQTH